MMKLPILIIVPHGGFRIPEELSGYEGVNDFDLFYESDACANEIFQFRDESLAYIDTYLSKLFVDMDRGPLELPPANDDGVIKRYTSQGKPVYGAGVFPDEIAVAAMIRRYHVPFHETIARVIATGEIRLILDCHTMMAVGPPGARDAGKPRPLVSVQNLIETPNGKEITADDIIARELLDALGREFSGEDSTVARRFSYNGPFFHGYLMGKYGQGAVPMLKLSLSRALFFNEKHFSYEYLKVDPLRLDVNPRQVMARHFKNHDKGSLTVVSGAYSICRGVSHR